MAFEWVKNTSFGKKLKEWSEIWQPAYDDISRWKTIKDIGTFSDETIKEWQEAWATIPAPLQKDIYKIFEKLRKLLDAEILAKIVELYLNYIVGKNDNQ